LEEADLVLGSMVNGDNTGISMDEGEVEASEVNQARIKVL
jgi:hypothetical protein